MIEFTMEKAYPYLLGNSRINSKIYQSSGERQRGVGECLEEATGWNEDP